MGGFIGTSAPMFLTVSGWTKKYNDIHILAFAAWDGVLHINASAEDENGNIERDFMSKDELRPLYLGVVALTNGSKEENK